MRDKADLIEGASSGLQDSSEVLIEVLADIRDLLKVLSEK